MSPVVIGNATLYLGDCLQVLAGLPSESVQCCVTSPPYFGLRDYGHAEQIGLEETPEQYIAKLVQVFREVRRVLRADGTLWLNIGDSYNNNPSTSDIPRHLQGNGTGAFQIPGEHQVQARRARPNKAQPLIDAGIKKKDLIGIPWMLAFALRADGWYLRQDIIWHKPNPMPESVTDRCTKAHEYLFLLTKSERYYFDADSIAERVTQSSIERLTQPTLLQQQGSARVPGKTNGNMKAVGGTDKRNRRSVWTVATQPYAGAHFATFPPDLIKPCILAGSRPGDSVLDPFNGSGTTGAVSLGLGRHYLGVELNPDYLALAVERITPAARQPDMFHAPAMAKPAPRIELGSLFAAA